MRALGLIAGKGLGAENGDQRTEIRDQRAGVALGANRSNVGKGDYRGLCCDNRGSSSGAALRERELFDCADDCATTIILTCGR